MLTSLLYKCVNKTNTLSPSPKCLKSPKISDSDFRKVRGLGRPKSSGFTNIFSRLRLEKI
jgi:hypothetical protein